MELKLIGHEDRYAVEQLMQNPMAASRMRAAAGSFSGRPIRLMTRFLSRFLIDLL